jgi:hypothetical protein
VRDPAVRDDLADRLFRYRFRPAHDLSVAVGLAWMHGRNPEEQRKVARSLMKSVACVARYLRQPVAWVEALTIDELNRWGDVLGEILVEERGGQADSESPDPWGIVRTDD